MLRFGWLCPVLGVCLWSVAAEAADRFEATRSDKLVERSHRIDLVMAPDHATMTVRRTVYNGGPRHDQATFWIDLPETAVATGLRTSALVKGKLVWYDGQLLEAEAAAAKYTELTGIGGYYPKDPALLSWRSQGSLALQVFPCPPSEDKTVEYTITLPVEYYRGRSALRLPALGSTTLAADIRVRPADRRDQLFLQGVPVAAGARLTWKIPTSPTVVLGDDDLVVVDMDDDDDDDELDPFEVLVSLARHNPPRLEGRVASVAASDTRHMVHFEVDAAAQISQAPKRARVVVLVDTSRSLTSDEIDGALAAAVATLGNFPDAEVEVLAFDRVTTPVFGRFVPAKTAIAGLTSLQLAQHNGSDVDAALAKAAELLDNTPRGSERRVLVLTDTLTRKSLTPERLRGALAATGALVHVGIPSGTSSSELARDDTHAWASAVRSTGGLVWDAEIDASTQPKSQQRNHKIFAEWVRPLRIDHLRVVTPGLDLTDEYLPESLDEGEGIEVLRLHTAALPWVRIEGELWATPMREAFTRTPSHGKLWAALVFGSDLLHELSEAEMMPLALYGGAVSPVTSYLAIEPGVRPSTEGLEVEEIGLGGIGLIGSGSGGGGAGAGSIAMDPNKWLRDELSRLRTACAAPPIKLATETTREEIVAVAVTAQTGGLEPVTSHCLHEGVWAWQLPNIGFRTDWAAYHVSA